MIRDEPTFEAVERDGWALLPPLDPPALHDLRALAAETAAALTRHARSSDVGFDELWGNPDLAYRREIQARLAGLLAPFFDRVFVGARAVLYNILVKRARAPRSAVPFHQDYAVIDERGGDTAIQVWIPLVDVTPENGALILVSGTHRDAPAVRPLDTQHPLAGHPVTALPPGAVQPRLAAGAGVVLTNRTAHASTPNATGEDRPAVGAVLVPRDAPLVHWVARGGRSELWEIGDEGLLALRPGELPPGARLIETVIAGGSPGAAPGPPVGRPGRA
jgi:Phytanoyl-CoA dioxygenase (PhyH)